MLCAKPRCLCELFLEQRRVVQLPCLGVPNESFCVLFFRRNQQLIEHTIWTHARLALRRTHTCFRVKAPMLPHVELPSGTNSASSGSGQRRAKRTPQHFSHNNAQQRRNLRAAWRKRAPPPAQMPSAITCRKRAVDAKRHTKSAAPVCAKLAPMSVPMAPWTTTPN